jgi:hypothetical protein
MPTRSLFVLLGAVVATAVGGAVVAVAASSGRHATPPPPKPLADALHDALTAPAPAGVTARVTFTNNLFPSGALLGNVGSALVSGASGRLWLTNDGRGRIELQSDAGDVQLVWSKTEASLYDASSNTVYRLALPAAGGATKQPGTPPTVAAISSFLAKLGQQLVLSGAQPTSVAGRPAYGVAVSPKDKGSLLGSARLAWDAERGVPLRVAVHATGSTTPALALTVTSISYGSVPSSSVAIAPPAGAKVVDLGAPSGSGGAAHPKPVTGLDAVRAAAGFDVVAPDTIAGLPRTDARLVGGRLVVLVYGQGPGAVVVTERKLDAAPGSSLFDLLPRISLDGATGHELTTQLGSVIEWQRAGVGFLLAGSVPPATAEAAARDVA